MKRRHLVLGAAGLGAVAAGLAQQRHQERAGAAAASGVVAPPPTLSADETAFWQAAFSRPDGPTLPMAGLRGRPLLLNFWGTWCPPCVKEMPDLDRFHREFSRSGWQVLGLAIDSPSAVRAFLAKTPVSYLIALGGIDGTDWVRRLGNAQGGLPYTVVFDRQGRIVQRKSGVSSARELAAWARTT